MKISGARAIVVFSALLVLGGLAFAVPIAVPSAEDLHVSGGAGQHFRIFRLRHGGRGGAARVLVARDGGAGDGCGQRR